jgi:hypothetical protein
LKETVAAPASGLRTFEGNVEVSGALTVDGIDMVNATNTALSEMTNLVKNTYYVIGFDGDIDGVNDEFAFTENNVYPIMVFLNGLTLTAGDDYTFDNGTNILTFNSAPQVGDKIMSLIVALGEPAPQLA